MMRKNSRWWIKWMAGWALLTLLGATASGQSAAGESYECFPSCSETDARMLSLAGFTYSSISGFFIQARITVPASAESFEIGVFDGDTGKDPDGFLNPGTGHWDEGTHELEYALYADPRGDGSKETLVAVWGGNRINPLAGPGWTASTSEMPDNDWWTVRVQTAAAARAKPNSAYVYSLRVSNSDADVRVSSSFKLRTTGSLEVGTQGQPWGVQAAVTATGKPDARVVYPQWDGSFSLPRPDFFLDTETTYDGSWSFRFEVAKGQHEIRLFDGDLDFGSVGRPAVPSGVAVQWCVDQADPDSIGLPDFALGTFAYPDRVAPAGHPADDNKLDFYRRPPCVQYALVDPSGNAYRNTNPSSEQEWEQFVVSSRSNATRNEADYAPAVSSDGVSYVPKGALQAGEWTLTISGLDLGNTVFFSGPPMKGTVAASLSGQIWLDSNGDGVRQASESGVSGVEAVLYQDNGDGVLTPSPRSGSPDPGYDKRIARRATGPDGSYRFGGLGAGKFFVVVDEATLPSGVVVSAVVGSCQAGAACPLRESEQGRGADFGVRSH